MPDRLYSDEEIAAILKLAAERQQLEPSAGGALVAPDSSDAGMTLAEVQNIAREVGIPAELVTQAATSLDRAGRPAVRRYLGLPIGVGRTVSLPRRLSQQEWERLVVDLRETFDARGTVREEGAFRQWTNGNLQALVEPTSTGQRIRLRTMNSISYTYINGGLVLVGLSALVEIGKVMSMVQNTSALLLTGIGAALIAAGALRLPRWARVRREQMEAIAARLSEDTAPPPTDLPALPSPPALKP